MNHKIASLIAMLTFAFAPAVNGDDFYISFSDLADGANAPTNVNTEFDLANETTGSAYIWIADGQNITGAFLDVFNSNTSVAAVTGFEVFNADILVPDLDIDVGDRWDPDSLAANNLALVNPEGLQGIRGFAVIETGINGNPANLDSPTDATNGSGTFIDELFDGTGGFLYGRIDFDLLAIGSSDLDVAASVDFGEGAPIVGNEELLFPTFGGASFTVIDSNAIPEPTSAAVLGVLGCFGLIRRKR